MSKHFMKYWLYESIERKIVSPEPLINYTASDQYRRVEVGDHLWFVTMPPKTQTLLLFGRMTAGWIGDRVEAARQLGTHPDALRAAELHILADPASAEPYEIIDITEIAMNLRFESALGNDRLPATRWPQALQTMRVLAPITITRLQDVWSSGGESLKSP